MVGVIALWFWSEGLRCVRHGSRADSGDGALLVCSPSVLPPSCEWALLFVWGGWALMYTLFSHGSSVSGMVVIYKIS